jgi:hypothetical protein
MFLCAVADRAMLKITEEEFSGPPIDVRMLDTGRSFFVVSIMPLNYEVFSVGVKLGFSWCRICV